MAINYQTTTLVRQNGAIVVSIDDLFVSVSNPDLAETGRGEALEDSTIINNLTTLAQHLTTVSNNHSVYKMVITSGFRNQELNTAAGGVANSRHKQGLAADVKFYNANGSQISPESVANFALQSGYFEEIVVYNTFTHLALPNGSVSRPRISYATAGNNRPESYLDYRYYDPFSARRGNTDFEEGAPYEFQEIDIYGENDGLLLQLDSYPSDERIPLEKLPDPIEGEFDIGDLRFGSTLVEAIDQSHLNQPIALTQQNAGSVGVVDLLRTDMNPVLQDNRVLPEVLLTISLNATQRDDVNKVLRPLVAMQRRFPFLAARNPDLSRLMLGLGVAGLDKSRLAEIRPDASQQELEDLAKLIEGRNPNSIWVPITIRRMTVVNQPGAADLYQINIVMRYANILPYVPELKFWKKTEDAVEWSRYLSVRGQQGVSVQSIADSGAASVVTPDLKTIDVVPPKEMGLNQTDDPGQSYVFKKFYRGLLEEFQGDRVGGYYRKFLREGRTQFVPPIGYSNSVIDPQGNISTVNGRLPIYEPGYPIGDPQRLFEVYVKDSPIELRYLTPMGLNTPEARMSRIISGFEKQSDFIRLLDETANTFSNSVALQELARLGKVSPLIISPGKDLGVIALSLRTTSNAFKNIARKVNESVLTNNRPDLPDHVTQFYLDTDGSIGERDSKYTDLFTDDTIADGFVRSITFAQGGGLVDFSVPDAKYQEVFVPFTAEISRIQQAILDSFASIIHTVETGSPDLINKYKTLYDQTYRSDNPSALQEEVDQEFRTYLLSSDFINKFINDPDVIAQYPVQIRQLKETFEQVTEYSKVVSNAIAGERQSVTEFYSGGSTRIQGFLSLRPSVIEGISLQFSQRYGERPWDGYPHPVCQHIGGGNAEVSLTIVTNDRILLDQLGEIKQAQLTLGELRKHRDVIPPLIDVFGEGNLLRSLGIKRLSYRAHTITILKDRPGFYNIQLDLIQDESTLVRSEQIQKVGGLGGDAVYQTTTVRPLMVPGVGTNLTGNGLYQLQRPLGFADYLTRLYRDSLTFDGYAPHFDWDTNDVYPATLYKQEQYEDALLNRSPIRIAASFIPRASRDGRQAFEIDVTEDTASAGTVSTVFSTTPANFDAFLQPIISFLDYAETEIDEFTYAWLVTQIENTLSTTGLSKGYLLGLYDLAVASKIQEELDNSRAARVVVNTALEEEVFTPTFTSIFLNRLVTNPFVEGVTNAAGAFNDNLTELTAKLLYGEELPAAIKFAGLSIEIAADSLSRSLVSNDAVRRMYQRWLDLNPAQIVSDEVFYDFTGVKDDIDTLDKHYKALATKVPSCYPDLLMNELRDPEQQINLMAYDFPFGPGQGDMTEDAFLTDYKFAESMRQMSALQMATIGLGAIETYVSDSPDPVYAGNTAPNNVRVNTDPTLRDTNVTKYAKAFNQAVDDIFTFAERRGSDLPFDVGTGDYFKQSFTDLAEKGVFSGKLPVKPLNRRDLVNILRVSQTAKYVTALIDYARVATGKDDDVSGALSFLGTDGIIASTVNAGQLSESLSSVVGVAEDFWLKRQRQNLINLYSTDPETIAGMLGFTDPTAEPARAQLTSKLKDQWTRWVGMRRAFPSYMMLIVGPIGSARFEVLGDIYSYSAVKSIETRKDQSMAGNYCDVVISNMRDRVAGIDSVTSIKSFETNRDMSLRVQPGTHMIIYQGYGPDVSHLYPFAGRVTEILPGAITAINISSYSTTLNNSPNDGEGFYIDGWDGQQTLSEAILYTISQTSGLEGLGRGSLSGALDTLGRASRGVLEDEYKISQLASMYRALGKPGLDKLLPRGSTNASAENLVDIVAKLGLTKVREKFLGDSRLYENVWLVSGRQRYGATNFVFGGFANWITSGKGWGWAALPGETTWAQLQDQTLLYPDYITTTRPYNIGLPLREITHHPLRQTLYFGPKHGSYIHTSSTALQTGSLTRLQGEEIRNVINQAVGVENGNPTENLKELYDQIFVNTFFFPTALRVVYEGSESPIEEIRTFFRALPDRALNFIGGLGNLSSTSAGDPFSLDTFRRVSEDNSDVIQRTTAELFPRTYQELNEQAAELFRVLPRELLSLIPDSFPEGDYNPDTMVSDLDTIGAYVASVGWNIFTVENEAGFATILNGEGRPTIQDFKNFVSLQNKRDQDSLLTAFAEDLSNLALESERFTNLTGQSPIADNPVLQHVRAKLLEEGFTPGGQFKSIVQHHSMNMYTNICTNEVRASMDDPDFANRIILTFPKDPDERLSAYTGQKGDLYSYDIQANPLISPDFISEITTYYPNLRLVWKEEAGLYAAQITNQEDKNKFTELIDTYEELLGQAEDSVNELEFDRDELVFGGGTVIPINEAISSTEAAITRIIDGIGSILIKPKYQTVAGNLLSKGLSRMYQGDLVLHGDPRLEPYHIIHMWDDVKQMHGPVEVDSVYHSFNSDGFYTVVKPKLVTTLRGMDPSLDILWLNYASYYNTLTTFLPRLVGNSVMQGALSATRSGIFRWAMRNIPKYFTKLSGSAALGQLGIAYTVLDAAYTITTTLFTAENERVQRYVGMMADVTDANPVIMLPLTYKQKPYTAGLTGAVGPATLRSAIVESLEDAQNTDITRSFDALQNYLGTGVGVQTISI